ncbi:MAG: 6-carboxytetrahydropterin synthase QueD [Candidatus Tectomicrobia bacterium]|uniref:6-carboxy-5,6,7,8-tetrahydropterin synthase n=1 Tax=Tectimicrobiota bacterium TaxID=2528274 RepID=A0A932FY88_UNCTE|nr:6-carboxytetrahydropterin synthase QueD [Candidatus Tectomicrobia bacterium]
MYELRVRSGFAAAHQLRGYQGSCENFHGHNWRVEVTVKAEALNEIGIGLDFRQIAQAARELLSQVDHRNLNEVEPFIESNPTSENLARWFYQELGRRLNGPGIRVSRVTVMETEDYAASYDEEG